MRPVIVLFAKAPVPGRVKTRLAELLGAAEAAEGHRAFVQDMLERAQLLADQADLELHTDIPTDAWKAAGVAQELQLGSEDLGERLLAAATAALRTGREQVLILGGDAPTLPLEHVRALLASRADAALGPSADGGFYGIALRRLHPAMFRGVVWSGTETLAETLRAVQRCGLTTELGPPWYDVDTPADLNRLLACPALPRHTAAWLRRLGEKVRLAPRMEV
ncbi:MAG: TIGR04282 family arsenosugar biosynthesis glycosyltransferase [Bryobacterales bacterium]|nr:TIGR04282 family arsenosugar biosynthesis glycosyltransferase [Bryobacteraceae bacterium]MDW8356161.1 TIGR04282 family arsenosugar biosynthesis glycosyltransferase [Bryobacterales bacterium]